MLFYFSLVRLKKKNIRNTLPFRKQRKIAFGNMFDIIDEIDLK